MIIICFSRRSLSIRNRLFQKCKHCSRYKELFETKKYYRYWWKANAARLLCCLYVRFFRHSFFLTFTFHFTVDIPLGRCVCVINLYTPIRCLRARYYIFLQGGLDISFFILHIAFLVPPPVDLIWRSRCNILKTYIKTFFVIYYIQYK
jgi:hypothetical protein